MAMYIGIKRLWYGDSFTEPVTQDTLSTWLAGAKEVQNSHQDTFTYEQDDPEQTDYINELSGTSYYTDKTSNGEKRMSWSMGAFDYEDRVALMGGSIIGDNKGWASPESIQGAIEKGVVAMTKTGNFIVFTKASIVAKVDTQEKALCLGVTATAQDSGISGVSDEYLIEGDGVEVA